MDTRAIGFAEQGYGIPVRYEKIQGSMCRGESVTRPCAHILLNDQLAGHSGFFVTCNVTEEIVRAGGG